MSAISPYVTIDSVRWFLQAQENKVSRLTGEPDFSPEDIVRAMQMAARRYNDIPPPEFQVSYNQLDDSRGFWYDAIAAILYRVLARRLQERDLQIAVGDGSINPIAKRLKFLLDEATRMEQTSAQSMADLKHAQNLSDGFAIIG